MSVQTTYSLIGPKGYEGQIADTREGHRKISRAIETAAGVGFGLVVSRGTDKNKQAVIGGTDPLGITIRDLTKEGTVEGANTGKYEQYDNASISENGPIWVKSATVIAAPGAEVRYDQTDGTITGAAVAGDIVALTGWEFDETTAAVDELVPIIKR
jgi:hypothetical protein